MNTTAKFAVGDEVQVINHSEPECNGEFGKIIDIDVAFSGERYYKVELDGYRYCDCTADELMEG
mgnify:CR=1 FL=1